MKNTIFTLIIFLLAACSSSAEFNLQMQQNSD